MDVYLYVDAITMISTHYSLLDLSRCSTTHSGSRGHKRDTAPVPSRESHPIHEFSNFPAIFYFLIRLLGNPGHEKSSGGLCDPNGFRETSPGSQRDDGGTHDQCHTP